MSNNLIEIFNLPDDIEIKVIRFAFIENHKDFEFAKILANGIPNFEDLQKYKGFVFIPIEGKTSINLQNKSSVAGVYRDNQFSFTIEKQKDADYSTINRFLYKTGVLIIHTTHYIYMIASYEEPIKYTTKDNIQSIDIDFYGQTRRPSLRKKISPF